MLSNLFHTLITTGKRISHPWMTFGVSVFFGMCLFFLSGYYSVDPLLAVAGKQEVIPPSGGVLLRESTVPTAPTRVDALPDGDLVSAKSIILRDVHSDTILFEKSATEVRSIASITKLMTALTLLDIGIDWNGVQTVAADTNLFDTHLYPGDTYTAHELWLAMLVGSSNRAAVSLVDMTGLSRDAFVVQMNALAGQLGMTSSTFVEPTGLDAGNISTATDILRMLDAALAQQPIRAALQTSALTVERPTKRDMHRMWNTNWLLIDWIPNNLYAVVGGKTGYIDASLYNFTTRVITAGGHVFDVVVLGAPTHEARFTDARDVVSAVLAAYSWDEELESNEQ